MKEPVKKKKISEQDSRIAGTIGTIVFHVVLLLFLLFFGIKAYLPQEEEGLSVNYGTDDNGSGLFEPAPQREIEEYLADEPEQVEEAVPAPVSEPAPVQEELIAQDSEESIKIKQQEEEARKKAEEQKRIEAEQKRLEEERRKAEEERQRKLAEQRKQEEAKRKKAMAAGQSAFGGGKGSSDSKAQSQGISAFGGNQGKPEGTLESNNYSGGNSGSGHSWGLNGRTITGRLPEPAYNKNEEGVIVVSIEVDGKGNVISAKAGAAGTTIGDATMRRNAEQAAMKAKFNGINENIIQSGTITYRYKLN